MQSPKFKPINGHVLVQRRPNKSGIRLSREVQRGVHADQGIVISAGDIGLWFKYVKGVKPGKIVHFTKYSPVTIVDGEEDYIYVQKNNILAINK